GAIASARAQTVREIEILVVDDGSTDETPAVLAAIDDPRLRIIRHEVNGGVARTRNTAIARGRGEWLAFLDDDNEWAPEYLERQLALAARNPRADVVYCRGQRHGGTRSHDVIMPAVVPEGWGLSQLGPGWVPPLSCP